MPEVAEIDLVRHFVNLSTKNISIDTNFYPLGSCTMKYNPKRHERLAALPGLAELHPLQDDASCQGMLELLWEMQNYPRGDRRPGRRVAAAGGRAQGELTALLVAAAYFRDRGEKRSRVLIPDSAHGTNPASAAIAGFDAVSIKSDGRGLVDLADLKAKLDDRAAVFMITNPNTLGLFDHQIAAITDLVHRHGALVYLDGANMNAILGVTRPGDFGVDMMHYNVHKTFTGPHGAGGPGAGPIAVREPLAPFLPAPVVVKDDDGFRLDYDRPKSIGRVRSFFGNVGILVRGWLYIRTLGPDGLRAVSENAVLNANYLLSRVKVGLRGAARRPLYARVRRQRRRLRKERGVSAMDVCKRLLDFGYHAPTVYFPLVVPEALMIEPTETESKETLDAFADALIRIHGEEAAVPPAGAAHARPEPARRGPRGRQPILRWKPE